MKIEVTLTNEEKKELLQKIKNEIKENITPKANGKTKANTKLIEVIFSNKPKVQGKIVNLLEKQGLTTVKKISRKSEEELKSIKGLGNTGIQMIKKALNNANLDLRG